METEDRKKSRAKRGAFIRTLLLIIYIFVLIYLYNLLIEFGANPLITFLIIIFVFLVITGPFIKNRRNKSLYAKMFPDKKKKYQTHYQNEESKIEDEKVSSEPKKIRNISLDFKYRRSIINKCENCGMIITSFAKTCPNCGKEITGKPIIKKCDNCGMIMANFVKKCPKCGKIVLQQKKNISL